VALDWPDRETYAFGNLALIEKCYEALTGLAAISQSQAEAEIEQTFDAIIENSPNSISCKYACLKLGRKHFDSGQWADAARYFELFRRHFGDEPGVVWPSVCISSTQLPRA
jgi:hypothetical protein